MAATLNDNIRVNARKPIKDTDVVGVGYRFANKEAIDPNIRYEYMETIEGGIKYMLIGGILDVHWKKYVVEGAPLKIMKFVATVDQADFTVPENVIKDDGLWTAQIGSALWNSTTGITAFTSALLTISFATGVVTCNTPLQGGTQVIFKYN